MSDYLISEETLTNLANSVRTISSENTEMTPDQMVMTMNNTKSAMDALNEHINNKINPHGVTAEQVDADPSGTASSAVSTHNDDTSAHNDIRQLIQQSAGYTKTEMLTNATRAAFGLGADAMPDDVLSWLGQYNQHWWRRKTLESITLYKEVQTEFSKKYDNYSYFKTITATGTLYVADSVTFDETTGKYTMDNPTSYAPGKSYEKEYDGKYIQSTDGRLSYCNSSGDVVGTIKDILYISNYSLKSAASGYAVYNAKSVYALESESYQVDVGEYSFVSSVDRNAYPDAGNDDSFSYIYLGIPLENAVTATKIAVGNYTGTGTVGSGNANKLTFNFAPKILFVMPANGATVAPTVMIGTINKQGSWSSSCGGQYIKVTFSGNSVSWYGLGTSWHGSGSSSSSATAAGQLNAGITYMYVAIG